jgi:hypothetical protein
MMPVPMVLAVLHATRDVFVPMAMARLLRAVLVPPARLLTGHLLRLSEEVRGGVARRPWRAGIGACAGPAREVPMPRQGRRHGMTACGCTVWRRAA